MISPTCESKHRRCACYVCVINCCYNYSSRLFWSCIRPIETDFSHLQAIYPYTVTHWIYKWIHFFFRARAQTIFHQTLWSNHKHFERKKTETKTTPNKKRSVFKRRKKKCLLTKQQHRMISAIFRSFVSCLFLFHLANELNCFGILLVGMISSSPAHKMCQLVYAIKVARTAKCQWTLWINVYMNGRCNHVEAAPKTHSIRIRFQFLWETFCFPCDSTCVFCFQSSLGLRSFVSMVDWKSVIEWHDKTGS